MYQKSKYYIAFLLGVFLLNSCVTNRTTRYLQDIEHGYARATRYPEYRIQPNDELLIRMFSANPELLNIFVQNSQGGYAQNQFGYIVREDSTITLPYVSSVKVGGLTVDEAAQTVQKALQAYIKDVFAVKMALANKVYYMIGEGGRGQYPVYKDRLTIFEALAQGRDLGVHANRKKIKILRNTAAGMQTMQFDLRAKDILDSEYYYILPNDIIYADRTAGSFFRITSFSVFLGTITSSFSFVLLAVQYSMTNSK